MPGHDIIVIGASAGGVEAAISLTSLLPPDLPASVFLVVHISAGHPSLLPDILARSTALAVSSAIDGEPIEPGRIYVAPADNHLLIANGFIRVVRGAKENGHRPAVDPLFRTAAHTYGSRVVGVVLTGMRDCGTVGLQEVKRHGGVAVVQDPRGALFASMPQSALDNVSVDHCLPLEHIPPLLTRLAREPAVALQGELSKEVEEPEVEFTCPDCGGNLTRRQSGSVLSFGCKVGHRYSPVALAAEQSAALEAALWIALRALEDNTALARRLEARAVEQGNSHVVAHFSERVRQGEVQAALVRQALLNASAGNGREGAVDPGSPRRRSRG